MKVNINEKLQSVFKIIKTNLFDARDINKFSDENPLFTIMTYLYNAFDFSWLNIPLQEFNNFVFAIQELYEKSNPYHNHIHSADVTQSMLFYLRSC